MKKPKPDFSCTPRELEQQIAIFFADAERGKIPMTDAALAYHVKLPYCRYRYLLNQGLYFLKNLVVSQFDSGLMQ